MSPVLLCSGEIAPVCVVSRSSTTELETGASLSHPDAAGLKGATLRAPIASAPQMSGLVGIASQPDVETGFRQDVGPSSGSEMGLSAQPTEPPRPPLEIGMVSSFVSGYHNVSESASGFHRMPIGDYVISGTADTSDISPTTTATRTTTVSIRNPSL